MTCKFCKNKEADQTGAHIFNFALIREIYNPKDNKQRGKEIVYGISTKDFLEVYFGNGIQPEQIQEVKGTDLTDEEIEKNNNPFTVDNTWCRKCEGKFKILEDYFMDNFYLKLRAGKQITNVSFAVIRLYLYSLFWRASATNYCNFFLAEYEEEKLRNLILKNVAQTIDKTIELAKTNSKLITKLPLIFNYQEPQDDFSQHLVYADLLKNPYLLIVNNIAIQLFFKDKLRQCEKRTYFGLNDIGVFTNSINLNETNFVITMTDKITSKRILDRIYNVIAKQKTKDYSILFSDTHFHFFKFRPSQQLIQIFLQRLTAEDHLAYGNSFEHFVQTMYKFFNDLSDQEQAKRHTTLGFVQVGRTE